MCEVNCTNCRVSAFKHGFCPDDFCEKHKALGTEDDFIRTLQRKTGKWIEVEKNYEAVECRCSLCGQTMTTYVGKRMKYCPNCGAKMKEGGQDG